MAASQHWVMTMIDNLAMGGYGDRCSSLVWVIGHVVVVSVVTIVGVVFNVLLWLFNLVLLCVVWWLWAFVGVGVGCCWVRIIFGFSDRWQGR